MTKKFILSINCSNDSFCDDGEATTESAAPEIARILREVAKRIESGDTFNMHRNLNDINKNIVGTSVFKHEVQA